MMKFLGLLFIFLISTSSYSQKIRGTSRSYMPRDKVKLKNGDSETGKIIFYDSTKILLQKIDYSEKQISRRDIDTITGLSHFTYFFSPSIGYMHWKGLVSQRLDTFSRDAMDIHFKYGYMRKKRFAGNLAFSYQGGNKHSLFHAGLGIRGYLFSNYVKDRSFYLGLSGGYNFPVTNMNRFFNLGWCMGYEFRILETYRFFIEYNKGTALKYDPPPSYFSWSGGMRFSLEYKDYYRKLNK